MDRKKTQVTFVCKYICIFYFVWWVIWWVYICMVGSSADLTAATASLIGRCLGVALVRVSSEHPVYLPSTIFFRPVAADQ